MRRPIAIDLFAGAGGMSLGFEQAGFDVVAAVEIDPVHCAVHAYNFPDCAIIARSVSDVTGDQVRTASGIGAREVDVVFGGAPCQGFSLIGKRVLDDPRNHLVLEFVRLVRELRPRAFVFENVKGLTVGKHKKFLEELSCMMASEGYQVALPWMVLNAADFGVPQDRQRLFLIGSRMGAAPSYPLPVYSRPGKASQGLPRGPSCSDALDDLPDAEAFEALLASDHVPASLPPPHSEFARAMRCLSNDCWHFGHPREWDSNVLTCSGRTDHSAISRRRFNATRPGTVEPVSRFFRLPADGVSNTLRAGTDGARGAFTSPRPIHHRHNRCVTVREMARLHGFPDWFRLHATKWHGARQIGNSVPPPLARHVAGAILSSLGMAPQHSSFSMKLGDPALLSMTVSEAAHHFGIPVPVMRRDKAGSYRKRKQDEVEAGLLPTRHAA